uniref:ATPase AAA-2 domain protein n=1 Tax=Solibacter usitatus (strain Ellin6076) TaxID=234267 RepID=Q01YP1_SOLUE
MVRTKQLLNPTQTGRESERLESDLRKRVIGQDEAIQQVLRIYQTHLAGLSSAGRPVGTLLFLGPTGSGKTRLVEAVAESLVGDARAVIKINCAEFQHSHEIAKLIGSPPGYLGHRETHAVLRQETLNQYHTEKVKLSFVLFDEIEKASDTLWNLLLGILDKATLTTGDNNKVDFSQALIFMTGNLGAAEMNSILSPTLGFAVLPSQEHQAQGVVDGELAQKLSRAAVEAARRKFTPEFMNRIDRTVVFRPLGIVQLRKILALELNDVQRRIFNAPNSIPFVVTVTEPARDYLLEQGTDMKYGARHLKRAVDRNIVQPISNLIATGQIRSGDLIRVDYDTAQSSLTFLKEWEDMPAVVMADLVDTSTLPLPASRRAGTAADFNSIANVRIMKR